MKKKVVLAVIGLIVLFGFFSAIGSDNTKGVSSEQPEITNTPTIEPALQAEDNQAVDAPTQNAIEQIAPTSMPENNVTDKINEIGRNFDVTIWNEQSELADEGETPYEVILNGSFTDPVASSCDEAKRVSYYILEKLYTDSEIRPTLSRVLITIPYFLRISWGASDGVPMAKNGSFAGPTNFWSVIESVGLGESEYGEMENRSWAVYLKNCE